MSDLQCPARFLLVSDPEASGAEGLRDERVAAVYADASATAAATALGLALGVPVHLLERPVALEGVLTGEAGDVTVLGDLADLHRGETVLVVSAGEGPGRAELEVDADGVRLT